MNKHYRRMIVALLFACLLLSACGQNMEAQSPEENHPITVEALTGADPTRETLTEDAARRLDLQTAEARDADVNGAKRTVIPYSSIIYDTAGATWVYLKSEPLTFVRHPITVDTIKG